MINKKEYQKQIFRTHGVIDENHEKTFNRVPVGWMPNNNSLDLREKIRNIIWQKADEYRDKNKVKISDYNFIELFCQIPGDTIKKAINGKYKISRSFLAKFTVGLKLELEVANLLFKECSGELNLTNDFDYIVYNALKTKDDIDFFLNELEEYTGICLNKER